MERGMRRMRRGLALAVTAPLVMAAPALAQAPAPEVLDPDLAVRPAASGLDQPTSMAFLGHDDFLVLEKASGKVKRIRDGAVQEVLDLAVNSNSERGLLGIALHPKFKQNGWVYLFWSQSKTGMDSATGDGVRLMGNRIDRFEWDDGRLEFDRGIMKFRAFQQDGTQQLRGNHDGGVIRFGPDGKLYAIVGDTGRRGNTQNLVDGPFGPGLPDDQFGGPETDDLHNTGVIVRLDEDGGAPRDNPFWRAGRAMGGEVGENVQKIFSYGLRNSFGMAFDPRSGRLWQQENGDDSFSELNRVPPGLNSGWVQIMGPASRVAQFKAIETTMVPDPPDPRAPNGYFGLQQERWLPTNIADTPAQALSRLFMLPGSSFSDPELSWKFEVAPGGIGFLDSDDLGRGYEDDLFMGGARDFLEGGHLFHFNLTRNRLDVDTDDPRLDDGVADNVGKWTLQESESLLFGRNFGVGTDIQTGPDGELYVVSLSHGTVYEIHRPRD